MAKRAVLIGSNGPKWQSTLDYALSDAYKFKSSLNLQCDFSAVVTDDGIRPLDALEVIRNAAAESSKSDTILFYFSGHGEIFKSRLFLMFNDTKRDIFSSALNADYILDAIQLSDARHKLVILDCCHAGGASFRGNEKMPVDKDRTTLVLCASDRLERTREIQSLCGGFMTHHICAIINDRSLVHVTAVSLADKLNDASILHNQTYPELKVPAPYLFGESRGHFVFRSYSGNLSLLQDIENRYIAPLILIPDKYIETVAAYHYDRSRWGRLISAVNTELSLLSNEGTGVSIGDLVITQDKTAFWFSFFYEASLSGHRTLATLIWCIINPLDISHPLRREGVDLLEGIKYDYDATAKIET